jgi:hypothetical protein
MLLHSEIFLFFLSFWSFEGDITRYEGGKKKGKRNRELKFVFLFPRLTSVT